MPDGDPEFLASVRDFWNGEAATLDEEPDHGPRDPTVRSAWTALLRAGLPDPAAAVARWMRLLRPSGRLFLEGQWWTGGGLAAEETRRLLLPYATSVRFVGLADPALWGGPITDERYLCAAFPS